MGRYGYAKVKFGQVRNKITQELSLSNVFFVIMALEAKFGWTAENRTKQLIVEKL